MLISFYQNNLNEILVNLLNAFSKNEKEEYSINSDQEKKCSNCGLTYADFVRTGKLGCSQCYEAFHNQIKPLLNRLHGHFKHMGKIPASIRIQADRIQKIEEIKNRLKQAVLKEEYEKAAELRDQIIEEEKRVQLQHNE